MTHEPTTMEHVYGPIPSRRLGQSLGISPIPRKYCNYSCIYCQLGRTDHLTHEREEFFDVGEIVAEFEEVLRTGTPFDVVTIVGEGEPTLYLRLGDLIDALAARTDRPVAVITNGALLTHPDVREELGRADIVIVTFSAWDEASFRRIHRPHPSIRFEAFLEGLRAFARTCGGQLWIGVMLLRGVNDDDASLARIAAHLRDIPHARLHVTTAVRPPAETAVEPVDAATLQHAAGILGGTPTDVDQLAGFHSAIADDYEAVLSIIARHPMNQFEVEGFLASRGSADASGLLARLHGDPAVSVVRYRGFDTFRLRPAPGRAGDRSQPSATT